MPTAFSTCNLPAPHATCDSRDSQCMAQLSSLPSPTCLHIGLGPPLYPKNQCHIVPWLLCPIAPSKVPGHTPDHTESILHCISSA